MSGMFNPAISDRSNSKVPDTLCRASATPFSPQSCSSSGVLNHSGGTVQGLHNVHGNVNISNVHWPYASRNSANIGGLSHGLQQAAGSTSSGRFSVYNPHNGLSQLSLGGSHGHSGVTNVGGYGQGVLPNVVNTGRIAHSVGHLVGGGNITITSGLGSAGMANQAGPSSRLNLTAPQMVNMQGNFYSAQGVPLSPNNYYNYMALLNDASAPQNATFGMNDYQLSGHLSSAGGSQGQYGWQQNQEFNVQSEELPSLPGNQDGLSALGFCEFPGDKHQKEHIQSNLMQYQQMAMERSSGFNYGDAYPTHYHQQQHHASSSEVSGNQDLHFLGFEQYQQFQPSHSYFANQFMDKDMELRSVPNQFGIHGFLKIIKKENPGLTSLAVGTDLTTLGLNLTSTEPLFKTFASPWADIPAKLEPEYTIPKCYNDRQQSALKQSDFTNFQLNTLLYIFYSMPKDEAQLFAANELYTRGWFYHRELRLWFTRPRDKVPLVKTSNYERGSYFIFNPCTWQLSRKDNFILDYDKIERMPPVPRD